MCRDLCELIKMAEKNWLLLTLHKYKDASSRNRFDSNIISTFSDLFQLKRCEISIRFIEADEYGRIEDLVAREDDEGREYKVDNIAIVEEWVEITGFM